MSTLSSSIADFIIGSGINKLEPVKGKPGLLKLPNTITVPIIGIIPTGDLGVGIRVKEGRILILEKGNQLDGFYLNMKGYCFLHELLPNKNTIWSQEKHKWWVVQVPKTIEKLRDIFKFLNSFLDKAPINTMINIRGKDEDFSLPYFLDQEDLLQLCKFSDPDSLSFLDSLEKEIFEASGVLWFQNLTLQRNIGYREIDFNEYTQDLSYQSKKFVKNRSKEQSPYYLASFFPYAFTIDEAEDRYNLPTRVILVIRAQVINPYIAHVQSGDPFTALHAIVNSATTEYVRDHALHNASQNVSNEHKGVIEELISGIKSRLRNKENFIGFDYRDVEIIDIDIVGPQAEELKKQTVLTYISEQKRINNIADSVTNKTVAENNAIAAGQEFSKSALEIKKAAESLGIPVSEYLEKVYSEIMKERQIGKYKPGGTNIELNGLQQLFNKQKGG